MNARKAAINKGGAGRRGRQSKVPPCARLQRCSRRWCRGIARRRRTLRSRSDSVGAVTGPSPDVENAMSKAVLGLTHDHRPRPWFGGRQSQCAQVVVTALPTPVQVQAAPAAAAPEAVKPAAPTPAARPGRLGGGGRRAPAARVVFHARVGGGARDRAVRGARRVAGGGVGRRVRVQVCPGREGTWGGGYPVWVRGLRGEGPKGNAFKPF